MTDESNKFGVTEMAELAISAKKAGWFPGEFGTLANNHQQLSDMHDVTVGFAEIRHVVHVIDGDVEPEEIPEFEYAYHMKASLYVHKHTKLGELRCERRGRDLWLNDRRVVLRVARNPHGEDFKTADELSKWLSEVRGDGVALNHNVAKFLLNNQALYPPSWNSRTLYFPGTVYRARWLRRGVEVGWEWLPEEFKCEFVPILTNGTNWNGGLQTWFDHVRGSTNIWRELPPALPVIE